MQENPLMIIGDPIHSPRLVTLAGELDIKLSRARMDAREVYLEALYEDARATLEEQQ